MNWLKSLFGNRHDEAIARRAKPCKAKKKQQISLNLEPLEDRVVPVVGYTVPQPLPGAFYDGVVQLKHFDAAGKLFKSSSGTLLKSGKHILTTAHGLTNNNGTIDAAKTEVRFLLADGGSGSRGVTMNVPPTSYFIHPQFDGNGDNDWSNDLAVLELPRIAPADADRYDLYRGTAEKGAVVSMVGFGDYGSGNRGAFRPSDGNRRLGRNVVDDTTSDHWWSSIRGGPNGTVLEIDFDSNRFDSLIAKGDSGGPWFIGNRIAGISTGVIENNWFGGDPEVEFGELGVAARVSYFANWIDGIVAQSQTVRLDLLQTDHGPGHHDIIVVDNAGNNVEIAINNRVVSTLPRTAVNQVFLNGSNDNEIFVVDRGSFSVRINGRGGAADALIGPSGRTNYWDIDGTGVGDINERVRFSNIETLVGGNGRDHFVFNPEAQIGTIHGGGGRDRLDYSNFDHGVVVNLERGSGSRFQRVFTVEDVTGSQHNDFLTGNDETNFLYGLGGNDGIDGRGGNDFLFGGHGTDTLVGGEGNDYLDGGRDFLPDHLFGGAGSDTFVRHINRVFLPGWMMYWIPEWDDTDVGLGDIFVERHW